MLNKSIDVIIPVYKPDEKLDKLIERLQKQTKKPNRIILMSTRDGKEHEREEKFGNIPNVSIYHIEKADFDHGGTRNLGASLSLAEFVLFMTQDAVPTDSHLIEAILKPFEQEEVAAVYGRQLAGKNAGEVEKYTRVFNYPEEDSIKSKKDLERLGIKTYFCSNVCAAYRKSVYDEMGGFVLKTIFNEDMIMASKMIGAGYSIGYAANAKVIHSHKYTYWQQFTRNFDLAVSQVQYKEIFAGVKSESEGIRLVKNSALHLIRVGKWYMIPDLILQSGFKFLGYKFGKNYEKLPKWLVKKLSMNPSYWDKV